MTDDKLRKRTFDSLSETERERLLAEVNEIEAEAHRGKEVGQ